MFVITDLENQRHPIKVWGPADVGVEDQCLKQAYNLAQLPFIHKWVALMPDNHAGIGMPIGGVIATEGVIIPNAVGVDIGCGMAFVQSNIKAAQLEEVTTKSGSLIQCIIGDILRNIPVGFAHHRDKQECVTVERAMADQSKYESGPELLGEIEDGYYQVGTLGGGNHFIELQKDEEDNVCIMLHSGSRHLGHKICKYYNNIARELNDKWYTSVPSEDGLAFLPVDTREGKAYINYMNLALDFARENREKMMQGVMEIFNKWCEKYVKMPADFSCHINCHHNYAAIENHYGKNVWVHRKGAIRVREGEPGIVPGAMGSFSYIVEGKQNSESFHSCSHGAGRSMTRTRAKEMYSVEKVMLDLKEAGVVLGKHNKNDVAEECRFSYKDIDVVMASQTDLVAPVKKLSTLGVVKG